MPELTGLPAGERVLWRGKPSWQALALRAFHLKGLTLYFSLLLVWHVTSAWWSGATLTSAAESGSRLLIPLTGGLLLLSGLAWLFSRTTRYTITSRRVVMEMGVALPKTLNIPFSLISSAALKSYRDGTGDIPLQLNGDNRVAYLLLWPHTRPWRLARTEPMLRAVPDAANVAALLAQALEAVSGAPGIAPTVIAAEAPAAPRAVAAA